MESLSREVLETNAETTKHINQVRVLLRMVAVELLQRGEIHDQSKLSPEEAETYAKFTPLLKASTYGSEEYKGFLRDMKPALDHHYSHNRHHPEFFDNGILGMNLIDLLEMYVDWLASTMRHKDGSIHRSININRDRFGMGDVLTSIFLNTARDFTAHGISNPYVADCASISSLSK